MLNDPILTSLIDRLRVVMDELRAVGHELGVPPERMAAVAAATAVPADPAPRPRVARPAQHRAVHAG